MNVTWNQLVSWTLGRTILPVGWSLKYEFRPSIPWHVNPHDVHKYWQSFNPEKHKVEFWFLTTEVRKEWEEKCLQDKYETFVNRSHVYCLWQRFTLTNGEGKTIVIQMDNQGSVKQVRKVKKIIEIEEWVEVP